MLIICTVKLRQYYCKACMYTVLCYVKKIKIKIQLLPIVTVLNVLVHCDGLQNNAHNNLLESGAPGNDGRVVVRSQ